MKIHKSQCGEGEIQSIVKAFLVVLKHKIKWKLTIKEKLRVLLIPAVRDTVLCVLNLI